MAVSPMLEHFGEELRVAREAAGKSQSQLAEEIQYSAALVAKVERGERRPSSDFAQRCDTALGTNGLLARIQRRLSREIIFAWFREWAAIEEEGTALRNFEPLYIPGLLQTEDYARAVFAGVGLLSADETEQQITARLERQEILTRGKPPLFTTVIDESVLRRPVGGPAVMREQLLHLVKLGGALPRVRIHVVPLGVGAYAGLDGPFVIATPPTGEDVVYVEGQLPAQVSDRPEHVRRAVDVWESIRGDALPQQRSLELITEVAESWS